MRMETISPKAHSCQCQIIPESPTCSMHTLWSSLLIPLYSDSPRGPYVLPKEALGHFHPAR